MTPEQIAEQQALYEKLGRDAARLMVVHEAGRILRSTHDRHRLASELLRTIADAVFARSGCVAALYADEMEILAIHGMTDAEAAAMTANPAEAAFWFAVADGAEPKRADDLAAVPGAPAGAGRPALAVYVPLWLEDRVLGVLALGSRVDDRPYAPADEEFVVSLASHLALALSSAELFAEKVRRIEQLDVLLKISREITSTLDIERVLQTIVQMLGMVVPNRRTTVALVSGATVSVQVSSDPAFDRKNAASHPLLPILRWTLEAKKKVNTCHAALLADPKADGRELLLQVLEPRKGPRGITVLPLEDDQGVLGLLAIECDPDVKPLDGDREELVAILANQTTVAIRNAELYQRVPMIGMLAPMLKKARPVPVGTRAWWIRAAVATFLGVGLLIPLPAAIPADAVVRPADPVAVRAATAGVVDQVMVTEGQRVERGAVLARLRDDEATMKLEQVAAAVRGARAEAGRAREEGDLAGFRAHEADAGALEERRRFLETELERTVLRAPTRGIVLTAQVERRAGQRLERGDTFLDLADLSSVEIEARVQQEDVDAVRPGATARVKLYAYPERTFRGRLTRIAPRGDEQHAFRVLVRVANTDGALRPGMTGSARVSASWRPFLWRPLAPLARWLRFKLWM